MKNNYIILIYSMMTLIGCSGTVTVQPGANNSIDIGGTVTTNTPSPVAQSTASPNPSGTPSPSPIPSTTLNIGVNLASISYWDPQSMYADVTAETSGWWADNTGLTQAQIQPFSVTIDNYPTTDAQVLSNFVGYPTGVYIVSFDHNVNTKVLIGWSESFKSAPQNQADSLPDSGGILHTTFSLQLNSGTPVMIFVHRVDPTKTSFLIKNLHILSPDASGSFRTPFLNKLAPFNVIRMMGMNNTNDAKTSASAIPDCPAKAWTDRTVSSNFSRSNNSQVFQAPARDGATYEEEIELANTLKKDLWINIPDCASDDFVTQLAALFHSQLNSTSKLYIEYSNETWNTGFGQWANIRDMSKSVTAIAALDDTTRVQVYTAYRLVQIMKIFQAAFSNRPKQIQGVLAGQIANVWTVSVGLDWLQLNVGDVKQWIQFLAGAPYIGPMSTDWSSYDTPMQAYFHDSQSYLQTKNPLWQMNAKADLATALDALFKTMGNYQIKNVNPWMASAKALQTKYGIPFIAYEGGQSLVAAWGSLANQTVIQPDGTTKTNQMVYYQFDPMHQAQSDPRMALAYDALLNGWKANFGSNLFMHLGFVNTPNNWGYWGLWENLSDAHSVKGDEVLKLMPPPSLLINLVNAVKSLF